METHFDLAVKEGTDWLVNGTVAEEEVAEFLNGNHDFEGHQRCPHCRTILSFEHFQDTADDNDGWHLDREYIFLRCTHCGHWHFKGTEGGNKCMDPQDSTQISSVAARFAPTLPNGCSHELAQYLRRHPAHWHRMSPKDLELLVAAIFRANYHDGEVIHVGQPHDRGVDVIFVEANGKKWLIQAKRREKPGRKEGFGTLQSILGAMALDGSRHGIIVSTADGFSYFAEQGRLDAERKGFQVELIDKGKLERMVTPLIPATPWDRIFSRPEIQYISKDVQRHFWGPECDGQLLLKL